MRVSQNVLKIGIVLLIVTLWSQSIELSFLASLIVLFTAIGNKLSGEIYRYSLLFGGLILIGALGVFRDHDGLYALIKDFIYFIRPLTIMLASYFAVSRLKSRTAFFDTIVLSGFAFAVMHLAHIALKFEYLSAGVSNLRYYFGRLNHVEMVALFLVICVKDLPVKRTRFRIVYQLMVALLVISFLMYFSRTMIVVLAVMVVAYYGYLKLNKRGLIALGILMILGAVFVYFLSQYDPPEADEAGIVETFLIKIKNSYSESFETIKFDRASYDWRELWSHWRAFEASLVIDEVNRDKVWFTGKGFGSTVDVGFMVPLDGESIRHLPTVHNGFAYIYMKTGLIGLLIYLYAALYLYLKYYERTGQDEIKGYNRILAATTFYFLMSAMVVTGVYKPYDMLTFLVGGVFALKRIAYLENRDHRHQGDT